MTLYDQIRELLTEAQSQQVRQTNILMVKTYFQIGKYIIEDEQKGQNRAEYGKETLKILSQKLRQEFGKGFSVENLDRMRFFYKIYASQISSTDLTKFDFMLSWSHYLVLMRIENIQERAFYEIEAIENNWSLRELKRQFDSALFERLALSTDKEGIKKLASQGQIIEKPQDALKEPYILEFLNLPEKHHYSESDLENALIDKLENFLLELGKGYTFVARQKRISFDEKHFYIDLVFFNRFLKCFVLIDLKIGELKAQDIGQMQLYVNFFDRNLKLPEENKTVGIILCKDKNDMLVEYALPQDNEQIFASRYQSILPDKNLLKKQLENI